MKKTLPLTIFLAACLPLCAVSATYGALAFDNQEPSPEELHLNVGSIEVSDQTKTIDPGMLTIGEVVGKRVSICQQQFVYRISAELTIPAGGIKDFWYDEYTVPVYYEYVIFGLNVASPVGMNFADCDCYVIGSYFGAVKLTNIETKFTNSSISFSLSTTDQYIDVDYERTGIYSLVQESNINQSKEALTFYAVFDFKLPSPSANISYDLASFIVEMSNTL